MARVVSPTERTDAGGSAVQCYHRLEITDSTELVWRDFGLLSIGATTADFVNAAQIADHIDQPTLAFEASLLRESGVYSLSPLRTDSPLNDEGGSYVPALDVGRFWRVTNAIVAPGTSLTGRWREVARGFIDYLNVQEPSPVIPIRGRGMEALFIDRDIEADLVYVSMPMEDLVQLIIDTYMGADAVTLAGTLSPGFMMDPGTVTAGQGVMAAIADIARLTGAVVRFVYNSSDVLELTIFRPNRSPSTPDWTIGNTEYKALTNMSLDVGPVVNAIDLTYPDATSGLLETISRPIGGTSASITRFRRRWMGITEPRINNSTDANGLIDAIFSDIEFPVMETAFESVGFWFVSLYDYGQLLANGLQFDTDQFGGVTGYTLAFANGQLTATVGMRGTPSGGYRTWLSMGDGAAVDPPTVLSASITVLYNEALLLPQILNSAKANTSTKSLLFEVSEDSDFSTLLYDENHDVDVDGTAIDFYIGTFTDLTRTYYLRVTPYSGPLDVPLVGVPTGVAGEPIVVSTYAERVATDSATVEVDRSVDGEIKFNVVGGGGLGGVLFRPINNEPPTSNFATLDVRNGHPVLDFDTTTQEAAIFTGVLSPTYGGGGITVTIYCALKSATSGTVGWDVAIERIDPSSLDIDSDSFATAQTVTATTVPGTSGQILKMSVSISNGANMDNLAAGDVYRLRVRRDVANDTATGDAELLAVTVS